MRFMVILSALVAAFFPCHAQAAQPLKATDYAIFSATSVELTSYSTAVGPIYSGGKLQLDFGYGIQRPSQNSGDMYARGDFVQDSLSQVTGNVFANQSISLNSSSTHVSGNATYGSTIAYSGTVGGTIIHQPNSVAAVNLPSATTFSPGFFDSIHNTDFTLAPGSYGAVQETGFFKSVHLSSGNYYLNSLSLLNSTSLYLDYTDQQPINVYVLGNINIDSGFKVYVNGTQVGNGNNNLQTGYASLTLFETHGNFVLSGGFLNYFYGTVFAPNGGITMNVQDMFGSLIASGPITGNVYMDLRPSRQLAVPEPASSVLAVLGAASLILTCRRRPRGSGGASSPVMDALPGSSTRAAGEHLR
jgi:hypothetical protein